MKDPDDVSYMQFTGPQQRDKALSELRGILQGFIADREFHPREVRELRDWQLEHQHLMGPIDFREINKSINQALTDGKLEAAEVEEILALCARAASNAPYFDAVTKVLQELFGYLHGILSDRIIKPDELKELMLWMDDYQFLRQVYPFTEIEALVVGVLRDKTVTAAEQKRLQAFFAQFVVLSPNQREFTDELKLNAKELCIGGICAVDPDIEFKQTRFCFTGFSTKGPRSLFAKEVEKRGGIFCDNVIQDLNYLVMGSAGNPSWAYSCYGRKVEAAVRLRKSGHPLLIVDETDFWDATIA